MTNACRCSFTRLVIVISALLFAACDGDKSPITKPSLSPEDEEIRNLVSQLASNNPKPEYREGAVFPRKPKQFDAAAQHRVHVAVARLHNYGFRAWPSLIEAAKLPMNWQRYSYTTSSAVWYNLNVAEACIDLMAEHVNIMPGYKSRTGADGQAHCAPDYFREVVCDGAIDAHEAVTKIDNWWHTNRGRTLRQVQLESINWAMNREHQIGEPVDKDEAVSFGEIKRVYEITLKKREAAKDEEAPFRRLEARECTPDFLNPDSVVASFVVIDSGETAEVPGKHHERAVGSVPDK